MAIAFELQDAIKQMKEAVEQVIKEDMEQAIAFKNLHQGYVDQALERFLKARDYNISKATKMLFDTMQWRINNGIDGILAKPIKPKELYDAIREGQLIGMTGFCKKGRPVFALGVGLSAYDNAPADKYVQSHIQINEYRDRILLPEQSENRGEFVGTCVKILDMSGLKLSALNRLKILTAISTIDDLNYPEKTDTYYIVNAPYVFSACWKAVKPLLQERTKRKVEVLRGCGKEELLKVMDYDVLPYFCKNDAKNSGSSKGRSGSGETMVNCFSSAHPFHVQIQEHIKQQAFLCKNTGPNSQPSFHVEVPEPDEEMQTVETAIEFALEKIAIEGRPNDSSEDDSSNHHHHHHHHHNNNNNSNNNGVNGK